MQVRALSLATRPRRAHEMQRCRDAEERGTAGAQSHSVRLTYSPKRAIYSFISATLTGNSSAPRSAGDTRPLTASPPSARHRPRQRPRRMQAGRADDAGPLIAVCTDASLLTYPSPAAVAAVLTRGCVMASRLGRGRAWHRLP